MRLVPSLEKYREYVKQAYGYEPTSGEKDNEVAFSLESASSYVTNVTHRALRGLVLDSVVVDNQLDKMAEEDDTNQPLYDVLFQAIYIYTYGEVVRYKHSGYNSDKATLDYMKNCTDFLDSYELIKY
jgi:hypothetical protein